MNTSIQHTLFEHIKAQVPPNESMNLLLCDVLSLSTDAVYRRLRLETPLTIDETQKLCEHFNLSFDALTQIKKGSAVFTYAPLSSYDFSLETYLEAILSALKRLRSLKDPKLFLCINNVHFFQLFNFPQLVRFRLFFWAKSHLMVPDYQLLKFRHEKTSERAFALGHEILQLYTVIPSKEIIDLDLMRGFMRQIVYYLEADLFEDPSYALFLCDRVKLLMEHYKLQMLEGKKFVFGTEVPLAGNHLETYLNDTINTDVTFLYQSQSEKGVYLTHNIMNYLHTSDENYFNDSLNILDKQMKQSSLISQVNIKQRNAYFSEIDRMVEGYKKTIQTILESNT